MERLTSNTDDISYLCNYLNRHSNFDGDRFKAIHKKLAEYEDIGLTPLEIKNFLKDFGISLLIKNRELKEQLDKALEKQTAKSITRKDMSESFKCPNCNEDRYWKDGNCCKDCGQKLDWS